MKIIQSENKDYSFEEKFTSFRGYEINARDHIWVLDINNKAYLKGILKFSQKIQQDILNLFIYFAKYYSSGYTISIIKAVLRYPVITGESYFTVKGMLNFKQFNNARKKEPIIAILRLFLKKAYDCGYNFSDKTIYLLIDSWRLRGSKRGIPVLTLDPDYGPFSQIEFEAIITRTNEYLAENKISYYEAALIRVFCATGRRPIQITSLKVKDLYISNKYKFEGNKAVHILNIPRAKMRYNCRFRAGFTEVGIRECIAKILFEHIKILKKKMSIIIGRKLSDEESAELPLFYDLINLTNLEWNNNKNLLQILSKEIIHISVNELTFILKKAIKKLGIRSRETGQLIHVNAYRFRYTLGTNASRQRGGKNVIAKLMDHSDTQSAHIYVQNIPEHAQQISSLMDESLRKYADAFQGLVVKDEIEAQTQVLNASRISCVEQECDVGSCGTHIYCQDFAPVACYLCSKFMPWRDAPHHLILELLIKERQDLIDMGCSLEIAAVNDRVILAIQQVIDNCKELEHG